MGEKPLLLSEMGLQELLAAKECLELQCPGSFPGWLGVGCDSDSEQEREKDSVWLSIKENKPDTTF